MNKLSAYILLSTFILASCGGGGGGGSAPTPSEPAASITFSASSSSVATGQIVTLTWSTTNATSCTASGGWSGTKSTSGNEDVATTYGTNTFSLSCTGSGGSSSKSVTVEGTQGFDATAFVGTGSKVYKGFLVHKGDDSCASIATVEFDLSGSDDATVLRFDGYRVYEVQYICYYFDDNDNPLGLQLSGDLYGDDYDYYDIPVVDNTLNGIYLNPSVSVDPFNYDPPDLDDLVQFSADINLDFDYGEDDGYFYPDIQMGVLALPNESSTDNTSAFIGTSETGDDYSFLYLVEKGSWDDNESNKPSESDILGTNYAKIDLYTAYQSLPNLVPNDYGLKVKSETFSQSDSAQDTYSTETLRGSFKADKITPTDNEIWSTNSYGVKYMFNSDPDSDQRVFFKMDTYQRFTNTYDIDNYEVYFLSPDKSGYVGFKLGGYDFGVEGDTNALLLFNNE